jgi:hypothetical protein
MSLRRDWEFPYQASKVLEGAKKKLAHHKDRLDWWRTKRDESMALIKDGGIEIDEGVAGVEYSKLSNYQRPQVQIRDDLLRDLNECVTKTKEHRRHVDAYGAWVEVLAEQGSRELKLDQEDWLYFFSEAPEKAVEDDDDSD